MNNFYVKMECQQTLHKRKDPSLTGGYDSCLRPGDFSVTFCPADGRMKANCWLSDLEGRRVGFVLSGTTLRMLHEQLTKALEQQAEYDNNQKHQDALKWLHETLYKRGEIND